MFVHVTAWHVSIARVYSRSVGATGTRGLTRGKLCPSGMFPRECKARGWLRLVTIFSSRAIHIQIQSRRSSTFQQRFERGFSYARCSGDDIDLPSAGTDAVLGIILPKSAPCHPAYLTSVPATDCTCKRASSTLWSSPSVNGARLQSNACVLSRLFLADVGLSRALTQES